MNENSRTLRKKCFQKKIPEYRKNPVLFVQEVLLFEPDEWQRAALIDLAGSPKVAIKSGQGVGKTGLEAVVLLWFLCCYPYARVVATAPTRQQLNDVLWSEISKWMSKSPLLSKILRWTKTYIYMAGNEKRWFAVARTATKPENMQGFHEDHMLFIVDEASGVADPIMEAILGTLSGQNNKLLMCGNPTRASGTFFDAFHSDRAIYKCHTVSSADSRRTNKENIASLIRKYGRESNVVLVRVFGEFPKQEDDIFIALSLVENSIMTDFLPRQAPAFIHIACDVARFGDDKTVIGYKIDEKAEFYKKRQGQDTMKTADDIILLGEMLVHKYKLNPGTDSPIPVKVDDGGVGGGVVDRLKQIKRNHPERFWWLEVYPVLFGQRIKHKYYHDSTTYMMAIVKKLLQPFDEDTGKEKPVGLILPNDNDLVAQLSGRKYTLTEAGKIKVESKEAMKKRGLPSPDEADYILLLSLPVKPPKRKGGRRDGESQGKTAGTYH